MKNPVIVKSALEEKTHLKKKIVRQSDLIYSLEKNDKRHDEETARLKRRIEEQDQII